MGFPRACALVFWLGCFSAHPAPGAPCATDGSCPASLVCSPATRTCEDHAVDAGHVIDARADAARDAYVIDALRVPSLIQQIGRSVPSAASLSITLAPPAIGDLLVLVGGDPNAPLATVTGGGTTWTRAAVSPANVNVEIWFGVTDGSSSTVTIALPNSSSPMSMVVSEWSGMAATNVLDVATVANGTTSPASAGAIVTTNARDLVVFAVGDGSPNTFGAPAPGTWTAMTGLGSPISQLEWYQLRASTGTIAPQVTETAGAWDAAIAAFRTAP
ncbi:MAG TPA: hypothetical protein VFQ65_09445 [Kofleriaceae bacterium]|nr:hypothetical protein [Kofleriaceae bacterium]